jgi:riboflavin kinase/FMN adenylyltransferase
VQNRRVDGARSLRARPGTTLVAVGNFDGVHLGHRAVVQAATREARERGLDPLVLTFDPHPAQVLGQRKIGILTSIDRKVELLLRIDPALRIVVEPFTLELAAKSPRDFAEQFVEGELGARVVIVGQNFRFGHRRAGDLPELRRLGEELGFEAHSQPLEGDAQGVYSSTRIRKAVAEGDLAQAERLLGRPHSIGGVVARGNERGRSIGFPTANLAEIVEALPPHGVYACLVDAVDSIGHATALAGGVANLGVRPTLSAGFALEVHMFDFDADVYDRRLRVHFVERLREERRFAGLSELTEQIRKDAATARGKLAARSPTSDADGAWY